VFYAERRIPLHDGILEETLDEVDYERHMERDFWARVAGQRAAERDQRLRTRAHRREGTRVSKQRQAHD
jgi:hypothetical protein